MVIGFNKKMKFLLFLWALCLRDEKEKPQAGLPQEALVYDRA
jgi:hypothetical protein